MKTVSPKRAPKLPEKLSDCLAVALADLIKVERQKRKYDVDMGIYHWPAGGKCTVCLAGAAMVGLGIRDHQLTHPNKFTAYNRRRLEAISDTAVRCPRSAFIEMHIPADSCPEFLELAHSRPFYDIDPAGFKAGIRKEIKALRKAGL